MKRGALLLGLAALAMGSCKPAPKAPANESVAAAEGRAPDPTVVMTERWGKLFADPAAAIAAANEFGYKAGPLKPTGMAPQFGAFGTKGVEQVLPEAKAPVTVTTNFFAHGPSADSLHDVSFFFDISDTTLNDTRAANNAQRLPARIVDGFLGRFEVGSGDDIKRAIKARTSGSAEMYGVRITVDSVPLPGKPNGRRLIVSISKSQESAARK